MHKQNSLKMLVFSLLIVSSLMSSQTIFAVGGEKIFVSVSNAGFSNDILYSINPDGTGTTQVFSFQNHPKHKTGRILSPRVSSDGRYIYFSSDNSYVYTPASRNIFKISVNGKSWEQITPGPNSGKWGTPCPCGTVTGKVTKENGQPWGNCPIFLEGVGMIYSKPDGTFSFDKVPEGKRWVVAYRPGSSVFDSQLVYVARGTIARVEFIPRSDFRWSFEHGAYHNDRLYFQSGLNSIQWMNTKTGNSKEVYKAVGQCTGLADVDGFDVAPKSGRLAIMDYQDGCPTNRGLYIADKNGFNLSLLVDMKSSNSCCGAGEVFWSPDENKVAFKACNNFQTCFFVYNARYGTMLGYICAPNQEFTIYNTYLCGWSPDGKWLLYYQYLDPARGYLCKVAVTPEGKIDQQSAKVLMSNIRISGATWGKVVQ